ncbi:MAG TPA: type II CRISPR RNA-guided endonuclease Cas9 [Lactobacillaceae bacterium]|jgi:CRISPR-associated endonuclease Csn1
MPYSIGLDIGTGSVGWAVIDDNYRLVKKYGKYLTGVRLFSEAETANGEDGKGRRSHRSSRRRKDRKKWRLREVDRLFKTKFPEMDPILWTNKAYSWVSRDDKRAGYRAAKKQLGRNPLQKFYKVPAGENFAWLVPFKWTDTQHPRPKYFEENTAYFPTIYHLRQALIETKHPERYSVEQVYLAIYHIVNSRGHFNFDVHAGVQSDAQLTQQLQALFQALQDLKITPVLSEGVEPTTSYVAKVPDATAVQKMAEILVKPDDSDARYTLKDKQQDLVAAYNDGVLEAQKKFDKKFIEQIFNGILGLTFNVSAAFKNVLEFDNLFSEERKYELKNATARENYDAFVAMSGELETALTAITTINDFLLLQTSTGGRPISRFMIEKYAQHAQQLALFKQLLGEFEQEATTQSLAKPLRWLYDQWIDYPNSVLMRQKKTAKKSAEATFGFVNSGGDDKAKLTPNGWLDYILNDPKLTDKGEPTADWQKITTLYVHIDQPAFQLTPKARQLLADLRASFAQYGVFPKQRDGQINRALPNSLHVDEFVAILTNMQTIYPELLSPDEFSNKEGVEQSQFVSLARFRVPYFVGPLVTDSQLSTWSWAVRREGFEDAKITPYNYATVIDLPKTQQAFIERLKVVDPRLWNDATYEDYLQDVNYQLPAQQDPRTLPLNSLVYQEFLVYEELNNFRFVDDLSRLNKDGEKIGNYLSPKIKHRIFKEIFQNPKNTGKITYEKIFDWLRAESLALNPTFTNKSLKRSFNNALKTYHQYLAAGVSQAQLDDPKNRTVFERIANLQTVLQEPQSITNALSALRPEAPFLTDAVIKNLSVRAAGYSKQSWKILEGLRDEDTGYTLLDMLKNAEKPTTFDAVYRLGGFAEMVDAINQTDQDTWREKIKKLDLSPMFKRPMIQAVRIIQDIEKYMGEAPAGVYVEVATDDEATQLRNRRKMTQNRFEQLKKWGVTVNNAYAKDILTQKTRSGKADKLFLYFLQEGKDIYTGQPFDGEVLAAIINGTDHLEIDHIHPYSRSFDDRLDNRVLTTSANNAYKGDANRVPEAFQQAGQGLWQALYKDGKGHLMSATKYKLLTSKNFKEDKERFVQRQLTGVRQITKNVVEILNSITTPAGEQRYPTFGVKAAWSQQLRNLILEDGLKNKPSKVRDLNDIHHAHDAYFIAQIGQTNHRLFPEMDMPNPPLRKIYDRMREFNVAGAHKNADHQSYGYLVAYVQANGFPGANNTDFMQNSKADLSIKQYIMSKMLLHKNGKGAKFYDETLARKGANDAVKVIKGKLAVPELYGSHSKAYSSGFKIVKKDDQHVKLLATYPFEVNKFEMPSNLLIQDLAGNRWVLRSPEVWGRALEFIPAIQDLSAFYDVLNNEAPNADHVARATELLASTKVRAMYPYLPVTTKISDFVKAVEYGGSYANGSGKDVVQDYSYQRQAKGGRTLPNTMMVVQQSPSGLFEKLVPITDFISE